VFLPASSKSKITPPAAEEKSREGAGLVLIVDDEEVVRRTAKASLERAGFDVLLAESGVTAVQTLTNKNSPPVSLVVLDMGMPEMSGKEVMQEIRVLGIKVPVLICSGYSEAEVVREFAGLDVAGFVQKPFTSRQIAEKVSAVLPVIGKRL